MFFLTIDYKFFNLIRMEWGSADGSTLNFDLIYQITITKYKNLWINISVEIINIIISHTTEQTYSYRRIYILKYMVTLHTFPFRLVLFDPF